MLALNDTGGTVYIAAPAAVVTISGDNASGVFQVDGGVTAYFGELTITGGSGTGGVDNFGTATLNNCTLSGNSAGGGAG